jgi:GNAT superfamily N-acetyltransferase
MADVVIEQLNPRAIDVVRPLWSAMREHHASITTHWGPVRDEAASWERRRADYVKWLDEPDAFCLVAWRGDVAVGYALVTLGGGSPSWPIDRVGELQSLSVLATERGTGVGARLLHAAEDQLGTLGVEHVFITAVAANTGARSFYEREGYETAFVTLERRMRR